MSLFRLAILLGLLAYFVPLDEADRSAEEDGADVTPVAALGAAHATFSDVTQFCDRNANVCETGRDVATIMALKAKAGARMVADYFETTGETTGNGDTDAAGDVQAVAVDPGLVGSVRPAIQRQIETDLDASSKPPLAQSPFPAPLPRPKPARG